MRLTVLRFTAVFSSPQNTIIAKALAVHEVSQLGTDKMGHDKKAGHRGDRSRRGAENTQVMGHIKEVKQEVGQIRGEPHRRWGTSRRRATREIGQIWGCAT